MCTAFQIKCSTLVTVPTKANMFINLSKSLSHKEQREPKVHTTDTTEFKKFIQKKDTDCRLHLAVHIQVIREDQSRHKDALFYRKDTNLGRKAHVINFNACFHSL